MPKTEEQNGNPKKEADEKSCRSTTMLLPLVLEEKPYIFFHAASPLRHRAL